MNHYYFNTDQSDEHQEAINPEEELANFHLTNHSYSPTINDRPGLESDLNEMEERFN